MMHYHLLTPGDSSPKLRKTHGVESAVLYLAPYTVAKRTTVCPWSTPGCRASCLYRAGRGQFSAVQQCRIRRTRLLLDQPDTFVGLLDRDLAKLADRAHKQGKPAVARLNGTSDLDWTATYRKHPKVGFWEYTKSTERVHAFLQGQLPANVLRVSYSRNELAGDAEALALRYLGAVVCVVFSTPRHAPLPYSWHGHRVKDGDKDDARWRDAPGSIVGLRAKGPARKDRTGFVVQVGTGG